MTNPAIEEFIVSEPENNNFLNPSRYVQNEVVVILSLPILRVSSLCSCAAHINVMKARSLQFRNHIIQVYDIQNMTCTSRWSFPCII